MLWSILAMVLIPAAAWAGQLLLNGVPIGKIEMGVTGLDTFEKCTQIKFLPNGDVTIDCPGYDIKGPPSTAAAEPAAKPVPPPDALGKVAHRYWLVAQNTTPVGQAQFDVDLYVNKKWIRRFKNTDTVAVIELTKNLAPGDNSIIFASTKSPGPRVSTSADVAYKFTIGDGDVVTTANNQQSLRLDHQLIQYQKTAADAESTTDERTLPAS
jgi:hypothetical protein